MSLMLPEAGEVMRRVACGDVCPAPPAHHNRSSENKELLRQQLLSASKDRLTEKTEPPKQKHLRNRQKNRWKLKFHHQALPQEYLDHYEQSLQKANAKQVQAQKQKAAEKKPESNDSNNIANETFKIWAQRLAGIQNETGTLTVPNVFNMAKQSPKVDDKKKKNPTIAPSKIVTYEDLPYMGEMTLNNSKPRRGRKPKKADICHLIYENYGTVVPGQPPPSQDRLNQLSMCPQYRSENAPTSTPKTDLQNKIISNLLERKLSQENKRRLENQSPQRFNSPDEPMPEAPITIPGPLHSDDEPLNLCIRDLHDLKLQIQKKFGNIYPSMPLVKSEIDETEGSTKSEQCNLQVPNAISVIQRNTNLPQTASSSPDLSRQTRNVSPALSEPAQSTSSHDNDGKFPGYVYWPNAGIYMHPLALQTQLLYYQRLAAAGQLPNDEQDRNSTPSSVNESVNTEPMDESKNKLVLKQISELLDPKVIKQVEEAKRSPDQSKMKRASPNSAGGPVKRKRSAIFIPPMPTKSNSTTPTTEVSICKFKFTGGSKPSLQEKKMLSVDSGGNFRYYSGTGNKGNKGYDYLQRDSNQGRNMETEASASSVAKVENQAVALTKEELNKKKRKSRKSLQREKLEQTFKEKGFLIQTQQLQSAEGATYCKFRQLRKFTRYLFRSWKDYLPGELDEQRANAETGHVQSPQPTGEGTGEWG